MIKPLKLPKKLLFLVNEKKRFKVAYGGRGSAKSWSYARALIVKAVEKKIRVLCTRKLQTSIANSVHKLLTDSNPTVMAMDACINHIIDMCAPEWQALAVPRFWVTRCCLTSLRIRLFVPALKLLSMI